MSLSKKYAKWILNIINVNIIFAIYAYYNTTTIIIHLLFNKIDNYEINIETLILRYFLVTDSSLFFILFFTHPFSMNNHHKRIALHFVICDILKRFGRYETGSKNS